MFVVQILSEKRASYFYHHATSHSSERKFFLGMHIIPGNENIQDTTVNKFGGTVLHCAKKATLLLETDCVVSLSTTLWSTLLYIENSSYRESMSTTLESFKAIQAALTPWELGI
jgi:hypothetical protein